MDPVALLRLVSEPTRHAMLAALMDGEQTAGALAERVGAEQSNASHHLRTLRDVGLVVARRDGRRQRYRLAHREVARLLHQVDQVAARLEAAALAKGLGVGSGDGFQGYG